MVRYRALSYGCTVENRFLYLAILSFLVVVFYAIYLIYGGPIGKIPGPFWAKSSRAWLLWYSRKGNMHRKMIELHKRHGKVVRTGPNEVSVSDCNAIKTIYGPGSKFRKSEWYSVFQGHRKFDLFAEREERIHGSQRRLVSRIYSMDGLKDLEPSVDKTIMNLLSRFDQLQGQPIDMSVWAQLFAFDVIGEVTFSTPFGYIAAGKDDGTFSQINAALECAAWIGQVPWLYWAHDWVTPVIGNRLAIGARHGSLRNFAAQQIEKSKSRGNDHHDILEKLIRVQKEKPEEMNDTAVLSMVTSNVFAGSDTTAISIGAILYYLSKFPIYTQKLLAEIEAVEKCGKIDTCITFEIAQKMPYLQACIYEALRCYPAVGMTLPRVTPEGGIEIDGRFLPEGTTVGVNPWVIHRDREIFGEDADAFRPDRWLGKDTRQMERFFFAFGSGSRVCLGRNLSWMEMSKLIPMLLLKFKIQLVDIQAELKENCWWFVKQKDLFMTLRAKVAD